MNKNMMSNRQQAQQNRHERMKKYGRWLFFNGVDYLPSDQKKVYAHERAKDAERKLRNAMSRSPKKTLETRETPVLASNARHQEKFTGPIEELNENSRDEGDKTLVI